MVDLSASEIERIRDRTIREIVMGKLRANGIEFGRGKSPDKKKMKEALSNLFNAVGSADQKKYV